MAQHRRTARFRWVRAREVGERGRPCGVEFPVCVTDGVIGRWCQHVERGGGQAVKCGQEVGHVLDATRLRREVGGTVDVLEEERVRGCACAVGEHPRHREAAAGKLAHQAGLCGCVEGRSGGEDAHDRSGYLGAHAR